MLGLTDIESMRLALDARWMFRNQRRGITKSLIEMYRQVRLLRPDWEIIAYHRAIESDEIRSLITDLSREINLTPCAIEMPGDRFDWWQRYRLPIAAWRDHADVLHCPANQFPSWSPMPVISTIHDLIPLDLPTGHATATTQQFEQSVRRACERAACITTPSQYTRSRLIDRYGVNEQRVHVVPWAADSSIDAVTDAERLRIRNQYQLTNRTVLHYGSREPRKNTTRLIDAWHAITPAQRSGWQLCIVGLDETGRQHFNNLCEQHAHRAGQPNNIQMHGYVDDEDANALLCESQILAYPSLSEGFGLPVLDAYAARAAVLTSHVTSLPEVAGDAAVLVDPTDTIGIASGLKQLMTDDHARSTCVWRGSTRLKTMTWQATAQQFITIVESAMPTATGHITVPTHTTDHHPTPGKSQQRAA